MKKGDKMTNHKTKIQINAPLLSIYSFEPLHSL